MLDILFLSYDETNREQNWLDLHNRFPRAQRVHGIKGVKNAHTIAADLSRSDFFFVVDGDNRINDNFSFEIDFIPQKDTLYVWRCFNPVNGLCYGYGGVKLYNKHLLLELNKPTQLDVATTVAPKYKPIFVTASTTAFNATPFEAWRGAFRESVKLTTTLLNNPSDSATRERLEAWCLKGTENMNGHWSVLGANQGQKFALTHSENLAQLALINDFEWLKQQYRLLNIENLLPSPAL